MNPITSIKSKTVALPIADVDTDQIIPARFLTTTSREGLGQKLFHDWRYNENGEENPNFLLNDKSNKNCGILLAGDNFGCGSSREHAPWALIDYGFKAVISSKIADIFKSNALKNGLLPIVVNKLILEKLMNHSGEMLYIDIKMSKIITSYNAEIDYEIDEFSKYCIIEGIDQLGYLQRNNKVIEKFEEKRTWTP
tara:strand:+ start:519 stop:1103 length:585 start_codon:yes stop_codon:yes gene_type:complete